MTKPKRKINYNKRHKFRKVRVFRREAWKNMGWRLARIGIPWSRAYDQFGQFGRNSQ